MIDFEKENPRKGQPKPPKNTKAIKILSPKPSTSIMNIQKVPKRKLQYPDSDSETETDTDPSDNCCMCKMFSPPGLDKCIWLIIVRVPNATTGVTSGSAQKSGLLGGMQTSTAHTLQET